MQINNIKHIREFKGYSQKYVAKKLGKSQPALSKIENGYTQLTDELIEQLSKILETEKERLCDEPSIVNARKYKETLPSLNDKIYVLLEQLTQNKKLLHDVEVNQKQLRRQINQLLTLLINK